MADISYTPQFQHDDWVDNVDRVEADGPNGFNTRFNTIESDLLAVSAVVGDIGAELTKIRPPEVTLSIAPTFHPIKGSNAWAILNTGVAEAPSAGLPNGVIPLALPHGARMTTLTVRGKGAASAGNTDFFLRRVAVVGGVSESVDSFSTASTPFNAPRVLPNTALNVVDLANFRYVFSANSGGFLASDPVTLFSIQLAYVNP
ncbi:hypothetical protein [Amycolatopsis nigrescens]|uniref:hypothetical protein n=1 Tax=Amycolatopsis nigrescens TaxID=381445 RepID=UPI00036C019A|nr:hypothetical protein [Amycolatopsis nigrescens]